MRYLVLVKFSDDDFSHPAKLWLFPDQANGHRKIESFAAQSLDDMELFDFLGEQMRSCDYLPDALRNISKRRKDCCYYLATFDSDLKIVEEDLLEIIQRQILDSVIDYSQQDFMSRSLTHVTSVFNTYATELLRGYLIHAMAMLQQYQPTAPTPNVSSRSAPAA